jgi:hypothetical protein
MRRRSWGFIYGIAIVIFIGGLVFGVERSRYFPIFVAFCMTYGAAATALMMWAGRKSSKG